MHLAILIVAFVALGLRSFYAVADGALLSIRFLGPAAIEALFLAAAIGLFFGRPLLKRSFWRVLFLILGVLTALTLGIFVPFAVFAATSETGGSLAIFGPLAQGIAIHLVLMAGLYLYVYRSPGIWSSGASLPLGGSGTMA